jgi:hypothetical protein
MMRTLTISDTGARASWAQTIKLTMIEGSGSDWYGYLWLNGKAYTITQDSKTDEASIHKVPT